MSRPKGYCPILTVIVVTLLTPLALAEASYKWSGEHRNGYWVDSDGNQHESINPAVRVSPRTSRLDLGDGRGTAKVIEEITSRDIFEGLGLEPYWQTADTCVGHAFGILLDYELILSGLAAPGKRVIDQQLYTQFLQQRFEEVYGDKVTDSTRIWESRVIYMAALFDPVLIDGEYHIARSDIGLGHGNIEGVMKYIRKFPKVCRTDLSATERGDAEDFIRDLEKMQGLENPVPLKQNSSVATNLKYILKRRDFSDEEIQQKIDAFGEEYKNPFGYINEVIFPECTSAENQVDVSPVLNRLETVFRGNSILSTNGAAEHFLKNHFRSHSARPVMVSICESFRDDFYLERDPQIAINSDEVITISYHPDKVSAYPFATFGSEGYTGKKDKTNYCNEYKIGHAFVIKGKRVVELPDGTQRTDFLIEDSRGGPQQLYMWAGAGDFHFWLDEKTLVENITSVTFFTDEELN